MLVYTRTEGGSQFSLTTHSGRLAEMKLSQALYPILLSLIAILLTLYLSPPKPTTISPPPPNPEFLFPKTHSTVLPNPSLFFSPHLLNTPLPTNSFFQNFALNSADQPEYLHPYLIKSSASSALTLSYPSLLSTSSFTSQIFTHDLTISSFPSSPHVISSFDDLTLTLLFPSSNLSFFLARGSPFLTCSVSNSSLSLSTVHAVLSVSPNHDRTKHTIELNNNQTWLLYATSPIDLTAHGVSLFTSSVFSGIVRVAVLPDPEMEEILDRFSSRYPVSGAAVFGKDGFDLQYKWEAKGPGDLLMLAHPLHVKLLKSFGNVTVLEGVKYQSIDGVLVGVVGESWVLRPEPVKITWHSVKGVEEGSKAEIVSALLKDVEGLRTLIATDSSYFYAKFVARAARLALIGEEVGCVEVVPAVGRYLRGAIEPWLDGSFSGNGFLYESEWGGIVTKQGSVDSGADFGFGVYNDHHYHLGYFLYGIAVLAKIDKEWGMKYKPQAYALAADFMNLDRRSDSHYPRLRNFDLYKLHSWAGGVTEFGDGRNQESTSEAVNAYYSAALLGLAYGDNGLFATGSMLAALEIQAAKMWWHVREGDNMYAPEFTKENRVVGMVWANKRDSNLWFAPAQWRECLLGIQLLPIVPITEELFSDVGYVRELVKWTEPALSREGVGEGWKGFVYSLQGVYDKGGALEKIRNLNGHDDGNSLTNLLWWIHSRGEEKDGCRVREKICAV